MSNHGVDAPRDSFPPLPPLLGNQSTFLTPSRTLEISGDEGTTPLQTAKSLRWETKMVDAFFQAYISIIAEGRESDGGLRQSSWDTVVAAVIEATPADRKHLVNAKKVKSKLDSYKQIWKWWKDHLAAVSGWGCREDGLPVTSPEIMVEYFQSHSTRRQFRDKLPPYFEQMQIVVGGKLATGSEAVDISEALMEIDTANDLDAEGEVDEDSIINSAVNLDSEGISSPNILLHQRSESVSSSTSPQSRSSSLRVTSRSMTNLRKRASESQANSQGKRSKAAERSHTDYLVYSVMELSDAVKKPVETRTTLERAAAIVEDEFSSQDGEYRLAILEMFEASELKAQLFCGMRSDTRVVWVRNQIGGRAE